MTAKKLATNNKGKKYEEYKIIYSKNTVFLTPPSLFAKWLTKPPPLKEEELKLALQGLTKTIAKVIYKQIRHRK